MSRRGANTGGAEHRGRILQQPSLFSDQEASGASRVPRVPNAARVETFYAPGLLLSLPKLALKPLPDNVVRPPLRQWTWPALKPYLGFTSDERIRLWQFQWWLMDLGVLAKDKKCNICKAFDYRTVYHAENYYDFSTCVPLCWSCHSALHKRASNRKWWDIVSYHSRSGSEWFTRLPPVEFDMAAWVRKEYGSASEDLFGSVFYPIPVDIPRCVLHAEQGVSLVGGARVGRRRANPDG